MAPLPSFSLSSLLVSAVALLIAALGSPATGASFRITADQDSDSYGGLSRRGATHSSPIVWPGASIPYILAELPDQLSEQLRDAMRRWEQNTCVRFVPKDGSHTTWVRYTKQDSGCWGPTGWPGADKGEVFVNLDVPNIGEMVRTLGLWEGCGRADLPVRQLGFLIGLISEHRRSDRDKFVHVIKHNVIRTEVPLLEPFNDTDNRELYDYNSVMHGHAHLFARDLGLRVTIKSRTKQRVSPNKIPTISDFKAVNRAYSCPEPKTRILIGCITAAVPADNEPSSYRFILDEHTVTWMRQNKYDSVRVEQVCQPARGPSPPTTWAHVRLGDAPGGELHPFTVRGVPRCRGGRGQHASRYRLWLCKAPAACAVPCRGSEDGRGLCPVLRGTTVDSEAVDVVDPKHWLCHPL